jgi:hypothetical protein
VPYCIDGLPAFDLASLRERFPNAFMVHFGSSARSKFYPQAMELAELALWKHDHGSDESRWHTVAVDGEDLDLLALLHRLATKLPNPKVLRADVLSVSVGCRRGGEYRYAYASKAKHQRVAKACESLASSLGVDYAGAADYLDKHLLRPVQRDMNRAREKLQREGFLDRLSEDLITVIAARRKPAEVHPSFRSIREMISAGDFQGAVDEYYSFLGDEPYGVLTPELLYLKRLGNIELAGRDVLYFLPPASRSNLVQDCLEEFVSCLDDAIRVLGDRNERLVEILQREAPTMAGFVKANQERVEKSVWLENGELQRDTTTRFTPASFGQKYGMCPEGRIFDHYPDQVAFCNRFEEVEDQKYHGFWVTYPESFIEENVLSRGLILRLVDAYRHVGWTWRGKRGTREPDFQTSTSISEIDKSSYGLAQLRYTGREHEIDGTRLYEVDLVRHLRGEDLGNPFLDAIQEVLHEGENKLREQHGLPRIGEGWVSEMRLCELVRCIFPDAEHHATPDWLKPQHLDIYIPAKSLAFEYQGQQHFGPVEFFGGESAYEQLKRRDARKARKCKQNGVRLIAWRYDWPVTREHLAEVLWKAGVGVPDNGEESA